jgi:NitT/TauT family transport system ATP-binding protein
MQPDLSFSDVSFRYEPHEPFILKDASFDLPDHTFTTIVGPSGGGKSTILRLAVGLVKPEKGTVTNRARTRMVFQNGGLLPWRTVRENVLLGFTGLTLSKHEREKRLHVELENLGLSDFANSYPRDLSGGQRQRVGIARALVSDPELLMLDEPFSALDVETTEHLSQELLTIFAERDITMLMISHSIEDAVQLSDQVFVFSGGIISHKIPISLPRPRIREHSDVEKVVKEIKKLIPAK